MQRLGINRVKTALLRHIDIALTDWTSNKAAGPQNPIPYRLSYDTDLNVRMKQTKENTLTLSVTATTVLSKDIVANRDEDEICGLDPITSFHQSQLRNNTDFSNDLLIDIAERAGLRAESKKDRVFQATPDQRHFLLHQSDSYNTLNNELSVSRNFIIHQNDITRVLAATKAVLEEHKQRETRDPRRG